MILPKDLGKFPVPECNRQIVFLGSRVPSQALIIPIHSGISDRPDKNPWPLLCRVDCVILHPTIGCFPSSISRQFVLKSHEVTTFESTHQSHLGGGFKYFLFSLPREMLQFDLRIFFRWVGEKPPIRESSSLHQLCHPPFFLTNKNLEIRWKISHGTVFFTTLPPRNAPPMGLEIFTYFFWLKFMANMWVFPRIMVPSNHPI